MCEYCGCQAVTAIDDLTREHDMVVNLIGEATDGTPADPTWPDRLVETLDLLRERILKEQDGVIPAALANLSPGDWNVIDTTRSTVGTLLPARP